MPFATIMSALAVGALLPGLQPLEPYSGHCWSAVLSKDAVDRHCFSPVFGGKHLRDVHVVTRNGQPVYSGETIYNLEAGQIVFTYWNSLGGVGRGTIALSGGDLAFSLVMRATPEATPQEVATIWRRTPAGYDVISGDDTRHFVRDDR